jgi:hypothetical protein
MYGKHLKSSLWRNLGKIGVLVALGNAAIGLVHYFPLFFGEDGAPLVRYFGMCFLGMAVGLLGLCIIDPHISSQEMADSAKEGNTGAGLVFLGRCIFLAVVILLCSSAVHAAETILSPPAAALSKLPILKDELKTYWSSLDDRAIIGAQIEQETCITLKHKSCWNEKAQLLTYREQGVGLGQLTRTFNSNKTVRMDALGEMVAKYPKELAGLSWANWSDPKLQLRAIVLKDRDNCNSIKNTKTQTDQLQMCMAAYNGGMGGLRSDRTACRGKVGCDPAIWFGHVEKTSLKSKLAMKGYGKSPFEINREYVVNVFKIRKPRYLILNA